MRTDINNPAENRVPVSISDKALVHAIVESGYPLQGQIAHFLANDFTVIEEWGFIDDEISTHRALDIYADKKWPGGTDVDPGMVLLIECKRSRHPYVFFRNHGVSEIWDFPVTSGIHKATVEIHESRGSKRLMWASAGNLLRLAKHPFASAPPVCGAFSKAHPKGDKVELSGTDPYNHAILPLVKALRHAKSSLSISHPQSLIFPRLILAVCVLDAPMLLVENPARADDPVLIPWVRVIRREAVKDSRGDFRNRFFGIDFVHAGYFETFVNEHAMPLGEVFATGAVAAAEALRSGAIVPSLDDWEVSDIRPRPRPPR